MDLTLTYLLIFAMAYLLGSISFSYIFIKKFHNKDLRNEGSGNLGMLNSYEASKDKVLTFAILMLDMTKAIYCIALVNLLFYESYLIGTIIAGIGIILGHNWNIFLRFRGGRGLAPAAGISMVVNFYPLIIWLASWAISKAFTKNIHISNCISSILTIAILWISPSDLIFSFDSWENITPDALRILFTAINILIILSHYKVLIEYKDAILRRSNAND